jgi:hypothetical protein
MTVRGPLSGDVTQSILPWNFFGRFLGQIGFININNAKTPDPGLETTIVEEVGSYGRQIGRLADALDVLVGTLDRSALDEKQLMAIMAFREQLSEVRAIKSKRRPDPDDDLSKPTARLASEAMPETGTRRRGGAIANS